ncbi:MAG: retroviral-like aspartic protease family protein, partial [Bacteroidales bacterium]|nr:retroviral-like aspartic protease family protein [Bacteroidales bacterium]
MKKSKNKWKKVLVIIAIIVAMITGGGYLFLQYLKSELEAKITGCKLETKNFQTVIDFEYVNNWIIVKAKVGGSDKEYPFIFDTGAQTVIMDSLLKEISITNYDKFGFGNKTGTAKHAFNNEIISLNSLELGNVRFGNIGAITAKNSKWGMLNCISAYGIIGYNVLQTCVFQIDYEKRQIIITDNDENLSNFGEIQWITYK